MKNKSDRVPYLSTKSLSDGQYDPSVVAANNKVFFAGVGTSCKVVLGYLETQ
jgi:hypothetical protein